VKIVRQLLIFILLVTSIQVTGQDVYRTKKVEEIISKAYGFKNSGDIGECLKLLQKYHKKRPKNVVVTIVLAEIYNDIDNKENALVYYKKAIETDSLYFPEAFMQAGRLAFAIPDYNDALRYFSGYKNSGGLVKEYLNEADRFISNCNFAINAIENPVDYKPVKVRYINSEHDEYWPSLNADESKLIVTRKICFKDDNSRVICDENFVYTDSVVINKFSEAISLSENVNTDLNEGAQTLTSDGRTMYFTACNRADGRGRCDIYESVLTGDEWSAPVNIGSPVNSYRWEAQPTVSADGRTLYFVSHRKSGYGGSDIYVSHKDNNGEWSAPVNLGPKVNTPFDESAPFIHPDGETLYFSSDGHTGMGGRDIFRVKRKSDTIWSDIKNLGYPINTNKDEEGFIVNTSGNKAYFATDIGRGNRRDIYTFELPQDIRPLASSYFGGVVIDKKTAMPLEAGIEVFRLDNAEPVYVGISDSVTGEFLFPVINNKQYAINVNKRGYLFYSDNITPVDSSIEDYKKTVHLLPIEKDASVILKNILFDIDSYTLKEESFVELNKIVDFMNLNGTVKIEISGHTDNTGVKAENMELSNNRAEVVKRYITDKGIGSDRIISKGYGAEKPIADNNTEEGRMENRRTEMKIID
jgi:outer membrane protein OmpA-like peptidoglycan-associated protein